MNEVRTVSWSREDLRDLKAAYTKAKEGKQKQFKFRDIDLVTGYAKYLIEYLDDEFKRREG
jgi:hypothetical protein